MSRTWSDVVGSFRQQMEITMPRGEFIMWLLLVLLFIGTVWWLFLYLHKKQNYRRATAYLDTYALSAGQQQILHNFIREACHNHPQHIQYELSSFNLWVEEKINQLQQQGVAITEDESFLTDIRQIRDTVFFHRHAARPFSSSRDLEVNTTLSLRISDYPVPYQAIITDTDDLSITLKLPDEVEMPRLTQGTPVIGSLAQPEAMYYFEADYIRSGGKLINSLQITHSRDWQIIQMRAHFRYPVRLPVSFSYLERLSKGGSIRETGKATVIELSGGGFTLISRFQGIEGALFSFDFNLVGKKLSPLTGRIMRRFQDISSSDFIVYNCEFVDLDPDFRENIIHYIFMKQREL